VAVDANPGQGPPPNRRETPTTQRQHWASITPGPTFPSCADPTRPSTTLGKRLCQIPDMLLLTADDRRAELGHHEYAHAKAQASSSPDGRIIM
jgi:hypothetical protein